MSDEREYIHLLGRRIRIPRRILDPPRNDTIIHDQGDRVDVWWQRRNSDYLGQHDRGFIRYEQPPANMPPRRSPRCHTGNENLRRQSGGLSDREDRDVPSTSGSPNTGGYSQSVMLGDLSPIPESMIDPLDTRAGEQRVPGPAYTSHDVGQESRPRIQFEAGTAPGMREGNRIYQSRYYSPPIFDRRSASRNKTRARSASSDFSLRQVSEATDPHGRNALSKGIEYLLPDDNRTDR